MTDMVSDHDMEKLICDKSFIKFNDENEDDYPKSNGEAVAGPDEEASHIFLNFIPWS
jgi:hypothetical protein